MLESRCSLNMQREFLRFEETGVQLTRALALNDNDLLYFHQIRDIPLNDKEMFARRRGGRVRRRSFVILNPISILTNFVTRFNTLTSVFG